MFEGVPPPRLRRGPVASAHGGGGGWRVSRPRGASRLARASRRCVGSMYCRFLFGLVVGAAGAVTVGRDASRCAGVRPFLRLKRRQVRLCAHNEATLERQVIDLLYPLDGAGASSHTTSRGTRAYTGYFAPDAATMATRQPDRRTLSVIVAVPSAAAPPPTFAPCHAPCSPDTSAMG